MDAGKPTPSTWTDLVSQLRGRAAAEPDRRAFLFVNGNDCAVLDQLSFGELDRMAGAIGDALIERGASGQPVLLQFPPGLELVAGFWGCLYAGALAVPLAVPAAHGADSAVHRVEAVVADARPACVLTTGSLEGQLDLRYRVSELRELGFRIAIDDLGGGHARMGTFSPLDTDFVKLDMSLVRDVDKHQMKQRLIRSVTQLCREQGIQVIGEGVETEAEAEVLVDLGCDLLQGYVIAKPALPFCDEL